jgi:hypothetical protein
MNLLAICGVTAGAIGLMKLGWAALQPLPEEMTGRREDRMEDHLALHAQHFPQLRQVLTALDANYVRRKTPGEIERSLREERRRIVERFLSGLAADFGRLERLMKMVREMSPAEPRFQQIQPTGRRFRSSCRIASLEIHSASLQPANRLARLTVPVGNLSAHVEAGMARLDPSARGQSLQMRQRSSEDPR